MLLLERRPARRRNLRRGHRGGISPKHPQVHIVVLVGRLVRLGESRLLIGRVAVVFLNCFFAVVIFIVVIIVVLVVIVIIVEASIFFVLCFLFCLSCEATNVVLFHKSVINCELCFHNHLLVPDPVVFTRHLAGELVELRSICAEIGGIRAKITGSDGDDKLVCGTTWCRGARRGTTGSDVPRSLGCRW